MNAFGVSDDLRTPDQAEKEVVRDNLLQRAPSIFTVFGEERRGRMETLVKAARMAYLDGVSVRHVERLSLVVLENFLEAFWHALVPPTKVPPMTARPNLGAEECCEVD